MKTLKPIRDMKDIQRGLKSLSQKDSQLKKVMKLAGEVPLRTRPAGFDSLCHIVVSQQLSVASADAIWSRLTDLVDPFTTSTLSGLTDKQVSKTGISRPKIKTIRSVARAIDEGLDLECLISKPVDEAHSKLCEIWGIGRWSADIYLLFCAGHPDIFPSGDVALQHAVTHALELAKKPTVEELDAISSKWSPWRGVAARLFWAYYRVLKKGQETLPI